MGPVVVAALIGEMGRTRAFKLAIWAWLRCGLLLLAIAFTLEKDERRLAASERTKSSRGELELRDVSARHEGYPGI